MRGLALALLGCSSGPSEAPPAPDEPEQPGNPFNELEPAELSAPASRIQLEHSSIIVVQWTQSELARVHVEYTIDDGEWLASPDRDLIAGDHEELLLGVPYDHDVAWRVVAVNGGGSAATDDQAARTPAPPTELPLPTLTVSDPDGWDPDMQYVLTSVSSDQQFIGRFWVVILDRRGRVVWAEQSALGKATMHARVSWNGDALLLDSNSYWGAFDGGVASAVFEKKIDGSITRVWATPGLHHPFTDMPDGSLAYGRIYAPYVNETLAVVDPDGNLSEIWNCETWLQQIGDDGYCGSNTLVYDEARDVFLFSLYSTETVLEIDPATGEPLRWFGHSSGSWAFDPPQSAFWYQHGGTYTPDGTLLISTHRTEAGGETIVREYELDADAQTLREVWNFGVGDGLWGEQMGEAHRLGNGNTLHNTGTLPRLREGTPDGDVVWDLAWANRTIGRSAPITSSLYAFAPERP